MQVNSGLGWTCDENFIINKENQIVGIDRLNNQYAKYNNKSAIAVKIKKYGGFNSWVILSTKQDAILCTPLYLFFIDGKVNIDGITWYIGSPLYGVSGGNDPAPELKWLNKNSPITSSIVIQKTVKEILAKANVIMEEK